MRLIRFGPPDREKPGVLTPAGERKDCSPLFADWDREFFEGAGIERLRCAWGTGADALPDVPQSARWGAPIARPGKLVCIGLNYRDHARESGIDPPQEPIFFLKAPNTVVGPYDQVLIPRKSRKTDWEVELGVVVGRTARYLDDPAAAEAHIAGYCISNDVSEREFQLERGGQWTKGKSCDSFNPLGPWLATPDELDDVNALRMRLDVNGAQMQDGSTGAMVFSVHYLVYYLSQFMTLEAGDLISTGTPSGVGLGRKPPRFLGPGDVMELSIDGLGTQRQTCVPA